MSTTIGAFKKLKEGDYQVIPYKAHKEWEFDESSIDNRDINVFKGELNNKTDLAAKTGSDAEMKATKDTVYRQIRHLYYGGSPNRGNGLNSTLIGNGQRAGDPYHTFGSNSDKTFTQLQDKKITWILTPQLVYGEKIKPGSIQLKDYSTGNTITLKDDGYGNLYDLVDSSSIGSLDQVTTEFLYDYDNLVGYWPLNGTLKDRSGDANDGTGGSNTFTSSAAYYKALTFVSESEHEVTLGTGTGSWTMDTGETGSYAFDLDDEFSLSIWVKKNRDGDVPTDGNENVMGIFGREGSKYGIDYYFTSSNQQIRAHIDDDNGGKWVTYNTTNDLTGSWNHVAMTYKPKSITGLNLYVNGVLRDTESTTDMTGSITGSVSQNLKLGSGDIVQGGNPEFFDGWLDEARIYNKTLTTTQVKALYDFPDGLPYVGNAFYEHGNIIVTAAEKYETIASGTQASDGFDLTFKGTVTNYEHVIYCTVGENEFNFTMNDSIRKRDEDGNIDEYDSVIDMASSSKFEPYITTIGLYDDYRRLVAVAKLAKPIKNDPQLVETFTIILDA